MGQCDLVRFFPGPRHLEILEVKGAQGRGVSRQQRQRLRRAAEFLGQVLRASVTLKIDTEIGQ